MADKLSLKDWMTDKGLAKWFVQLNAVNAPRPRANLKTALKFFDSKMPTLKADDALNFMLATDMSKSVRSVMLTSKDNIIAFRTGNESPFKLFYTRSGASKHSSGINPVGRSIVRFSVRSACPALESYTTGAKDVWSIPADGQNLTVYLRNKKSSIGVTAFGGGIQLIIPNSQRYLDVV